jgi:hypothetical protein
MRSRELRDDEKQLAAGVFKTSIPLNKVRILPYSAPDGAAFTPPGFGIRYPICMGKAGFADAINGYYSRRPGDTLIHELTHVWQGIYGSTCVSYAVNSLYHQAKAFLGGGSRHGAYSFTPGQPWYSYNAEQQASIVETWFANGSDSVDELYPYIVNNIWAPVALVPAGP